MIDRLRAQRRFRPAATVGPARESDWKDFADSISPFIFDREEPLAVIDINNVNEYFHSDPHKDRGGWRLMDFPSLAPPWPSMWMEFQDTATDGETKFGVGVFALYQPFDEKFKATVLKQQPGTEIINAPDTAKWVGFFIMFVEYGNVIAGPGLIIQCIINEDGSLHHAGVIHFEDYEGCDRRAIEEDSVMAFPGLLAISLLHCKNVDTVEHKVCAPLVKKWLKRHDDRPVTYKTLVIEPMKKVLRSEGASGTEGLKKAMHICRGHFADYRNGRGLFGKYRKLVWQPTMVRGSRGKIENVPKQRDVVIVK